MKRFEKQFEQSTADQIFIDILLPIEVFVGIALNVVVICIWLFGPKSKGLCCAVYFAALAGIDLLTLSIPGILKYMYRSDLLTNEAADENKDYSKLKIICRVKQTTLPPFLQSSNWITVALTLERTLTVLLPFVFQSQNMRIRSKYVVSAIVIVSLSINAIVTFTQFDDSALQFKDLESYLSYCFYFYKRSDVTLVLELCFRVIIPFVLIITLNGATVVSLCKTKVERNSANRRSPVHVFTKLTVLTGITFTIANNADAVFALTRMFSVNINVKFVVNHREEFLYLNNVMNPIVCFVVCRSARDDVKTFLLSLARRLRFICCCRRSQRVISIANVESGTGNRANKRHDLCVETNAESAAGAIVTVEFDLTNKGSDTDARTIDESEIREKTNKEKDTDVTTNEGSYAGLKSNQGSDKGASSSQEPDKGVSTREGNETDARSSEKCDKGASTREGPDIDARLSDEPKKRR